MRVGSWLLLGAMLGLPPEPALGDDPLQAAVAESVITPPVGVPLAGYGGRHRFPDIFGLDPFAFYLKPSTWVLDPIKARALVLEKGAERLVFVGLDLVGIPPHLRSSLLTQLSLPPDDDTVFLSATHTHSGPGTFVQNDLLEAGVTDRFEAGIYAGLVDGVALAISAAEGNLGPAKLYQMSFTVDAPELQKNREEPSGPVDRQAHLLLIEGAEANQPGTWLGGMVNFAIHGTALGDDNLGYSGDVPGAIADGVGAFLGGENPDGSPVPVLFVNGAEGDVSPIQHGPAALETLADHFVQQVQSAFGGRQPVADPTWDVQTAKVDLKSPFLYLEHHDDALPPAFALKNLGIDLRPWLPTETTIWSIRLGDLRLMTWPGEATSRLGLALRSLATAAGASQAWVLGLTNDYLGYFTTPEEFGSGGYAASASIYGRYGGHKILMEHCRLLPSCL